ncbi:MAG: cobaltochelatase subunit CobS, partial [Alphaproteobacteria bacterium]
MPEGSPDMRVSASQVFGIDTDMEAPAFSQVSEHVPEIEEAYHFDRDTTLSILAGFA